MSEVERGRARETGKGTSYTCIHVREMKKEGKASKVKQTYMLDR